MAELLWDDVRWFFDPEMMGSLPDVWVPNASERDWQAVLDLVVERGWAFQYREGSAALPLPPARAVLSRPADAEQPHLEVRPVQDMLAIFRFYAAEEIDFDVDLREIQGQEPLDALSGFLAAIGRRLGKPVLMGAEGGDGSRPVLGFDVEADRVVMLVEPPVR
ncbi:hypothetical protein [Streptomyces barringtoniae]|uniref:hypothetical protein n=1 Tax=Streptomyces barringtoniae TaxID=2892029 RepID=UPI001E2D618D|nr:hypothetical protein [Streptomyces barringtoniae]MCC5478395.1 hypothetical protein [Streptomyces barringtoniae]